MFMRAWVKFSSRRICPYEVSILTKTSVQAHILIIGGTRGLGHESIKILAAEHDILSVIGRRIPREPRQKIAKTCYWSADLLAWEQLSGVLKEIINRNGKLTNLVFFQRFRGDNDQWAGELETTLTATKNVIEGLVDSFIENGDKSIVVVGSVAAQFILDEQPVGYHVAKAGLHQMVRYYALTLGHRGIRVNSVSPATFLKEESKDFYLLNSELSDLYSSINPLGRMGTTQDIANVIAFLCSSRASFITGQNLIVDGGASLRAPESLARKLASINQLDMTRRNQEPSV